MPVEAGELRERFGFEKRGDLSTNSPQGDGYGNTVDDDWSEVFVCFAKRVFLRGNESVIAARLQGRKPAILTVRYSSHTSSITTSWRCVDKRSGEIFNIREVTVTVDRADIELLIELGVNPG